MDLFCCPLCAAPLVRADAALQCAANHSFDIARQGYVNLLPSHHRRSARSGDNAEMVAARRSFLGAGHYLPLMDALAARVPAAARVLDLGCGEGSITSVLGGACRYGVDISRPAVRAATGLCPEVVFAVANARQLPFADACFDLVCVAMAPLFADAARVLDEDGVLLRVTPGPDHLAELKTRVFAEVRAHAPAPDVIEGFVRVDAQRVRHTMRLAAGARSQLLAMTPMQFRAPPERLGDLVALPGELKITADFMIDVFRRLPTAGPAES